MSRPSFRPRPIDHGKPLPIIKSSKDLRNEDDVVVSRSLPAIATGVDPSEEEERHLQQALLASVYATKPVDIPIPVFSKVQRVAYPQRKGPFRRPPAYIHFDKSDRDLEHVTIDYDADFEDEQFLKKLHLQHPAPPGTKNKPLTLGQLEMAMDVLEKHQGTLENDDKTTVPYATVRAALANALGAFSDTCRRAVFAHWSNRRQRHKHSFLRLYQRQPDPSDPNPAVAFRPRDKDAAAANGRRLNTYENFKRAQNIRAELVRLRKIFQTQIQREKYKAELLAVNALRARLSLIAQGGPRIELIARRLLASSKDAVVLPPGGPSTVTHTALASDDLNFPMSTCQSVPLPEDALSASLAAIATEKVPKKVVRRSGARGTDKSRTEPESIAETARANVRAVGQAAVDNYFFDDLGNRFLKHMRYFAGGFLNYGVSPYDHRVFTAASERNTVRELANDPPPFTFPSPLVEFAQLPEDKAARIKAARKAFELSKQGKLSSNENESEEDDDVSLTPAPPKRPRHETPMRVRGRIGRGGRIILDRVSYERERGVKAASYPASVEAGGVYTGGFPIEAAPRLLRSGIKKTELGSMALIQPRPLDDSTDDSSDDYRTLIRPLKPVSQLSRGVIQSNGTISYWPHRGTSGGKRGRGRRGGKTGSTRTRPTANIEVKGSYPSTDDQVDSCTKAIRSLPAYAPLPTSLVTEVSSDSSTPTLSPAPSTP